MPSDHQRNSDSPNAPGTSATGAAHPPPHPEKRSFAYRAGMRLGRRMTLTCSAISAVLFAFCMAWFFAFAMVIPSLAPRFDPDDLIFRWTAGVTISFALAFLMIAAISFARQHGWLAPQHAFAASIVSLGYGIIDAVASIALAINIETANSGSPEPLLGPIQPILGHLDMTLLRASWVAWALAAAITVSGLTISRRLEPGLRAIVGLLVGALLAPFTFAVDVFLWMGAIVAPLALFAVTKSSNRPKHPPYPIMRPAQGPLIADCNASYPSQWKQAVAPSAGPALPYTAPVRPSPPRMFSTPARQRPLDILSDRRVLSIRLLGACATVLGALAACCVIVRITGIVTFASRRTLLALGVPIGFIAFIPVLVAIGLWASGRCSHKAVHVWAPVALACASAVGFAALYWVEVTGGDNVSVLPLHSVLALCCGTALIWAILVWTPYPPNIRVLGGIALGMACTLLAIMFFQDAISVPPIIGLILTGAFPHLRPLKFPEPADARTSD